MKSFNNAARGLILSLAITLPAGACFDDEAPAAEETVHTRLARLDVAQRWHDAFARAAKAGPEARIEALRAYLQELGEAQAAELARHYEVPWFEAGQIRMSLVGELVRLERFDEASAELARAARMKSRPLPRTRLAYMKAMTDLHLDPNGDVVVDPTKQQALRDQLREAERDLPPDAWSEALDYRLAVLAYITGDLADAAARTTGRAREIVDDPSAVTDVRKATTVLRIAGDALGAQGRHAERAEIETTIHQLEQGSTTP